MNSAMIHFPLLSLAAMACWVNVLPCTSLAWTAGMVPGIAMTGAERQPTPPVAAPAAKAPVVATTADDLLNALETADANLRTLSADIQYDKLDGITGDRQTRRGKLFFQNDLAPAPVETETFDDAPATKGRRIFSVRFDSLQLGSRREEEQQLFIFDGEWLTEVTPKAKQVIKRQVTRPGSNFDPLKIGEGPLPLPIGQKKADMLARFDVTLLKDIEQLNGEDAEESARLRRFVAGAYQLRLVPKAGTPEADKFAEIRLWYREGDATEAPGAAPVRRLLPRMARTIAPKSGNVALVQMINVKTNGPIDAAMMGVEAVGSDWEVVVESLPAPDNTGVMEIKVVK